MGRERLFECDVGCGSSTSKEYALVGGKLSGGGNLGKILEPSCCHVGRVAPESQEGSLTAMFGRWMWAAVANRNRDGEVRQVAKETT